jgi:uncharacterized caspase-like protein
MRFLAIVTAAIWAMLSLLVIGPTPSWAATEKRVALVIGNSSYQYASRLSNPGNDAAAIAALLRNAGFDVVESKYDLRINDMKRTIRDFTDMTRDADIAVVYYAGHGIEVDGTNYLVPVNAELARDIDVEDEAVSLDRVLRVLDPVKRLRLVILDACRDNPFTNKMKRTVGSRSIGRGLAKVEVQSPDTLVAFAARAGSTASDGDGKHSPFASALIKNLVTPGLDLRLALGRVRDDVLKATNSKQEPFVYGSLGGATMALLPHPSAPEQTSVAPSTSDLQAEMRRDYEMAERIGTKAAWDYFLSAYRTGFYAGLARAAREKIDQEERRATATAPPNIVVAAVNPTEPVKPAVDASHVARQLQLELRRIGCYLGAVNGDWNGDSRRAMELFNRHAGVKLDVKTASLDALDVTKGKTIRVCPLQCERGFKAEGEACTKITCPAGQVLGGDNTCHPVKEKTRSAARPGTRGEAEAKPAGGGTGTIVCGRGGCEQAVKGKCYAETMPGGARQTCY